MVNKCEMFYQTNVAKGADANPNALPAQQSAALTTFPNYKVSWETEHRAAPELTPTQSPQKGHCSIPHLSAYVRKETVMH